MSKSSAAAFKRRRESVEAYQRGARPDLVAKEQFEVDTLETYLPPPVSTDTIRAAVRTVIAGGASTMGAVMGQVLPQFKGQADGGVISTIVREELAARG